MKTKKIKVRQGFTIVELVIVIGVIGVLTAVLIPTFINLNRKAEEASNQSFVKNLNTQMAIREQSEGKNKTMFDAVEDAREIGFDVEKLTPVNGRDLVWDSVANRFLLLNQDGSIFYGESDKKATKDIDMWKIYNAMPLEQKYSIYAKEGWNVSNVTDLNVGFDVGSNKTIKSISYQNTGAAKEAVIRTDGSTLTIDAPLDEIKHFGKADYVDVIAIKGSSYHESGTTSLLRVTKGRVALESESNVGEIHLAASNAGHFEDIIIAPATDVKLPGLSRDPVNTSSGDVLVCAVESQNSTQYYWMSGNGLIDENEVLISSNKAGTDKAPATIENQTAVAIANETAGIDSGSTILPASEMTEDEIKEATASGAAKTFAEISSIDELRAFRDAWNDGKIAGGAFNLTADVDISGEGWRPIGNIAHPFYGSFNGNGHTIKGLTNAGYSVDTADIWTTDSTGHTGSAYGFFGLIGSKIGSEDVDINNIKFTNVNIDVALSNAVAAVAGADVGAAKANANNNYAGDIEIKNIEVGGTLIKGEDSIGAILGKAYTLGNIKVTDCSTDIAVRTDVQGKKIAGLVGFASKANSIYVKNNTVKGNVYFAGKATSKDITGARNYVNMTVITGARFGKNFVFGNSVNDVTGKIYNGENEYLDPFALAYTFDEGGNATSATFNYIPQASRQEGKQYLDNNLVLFHDGSIVNGLYCNDGTNDNGKMKLIDVFGTVVMNDCSVYGSFNAENGAALTLNNCYVKQYVHAKDRTTKVGNDYGVGTGTVLINGGSYLGLKDDNTVSEIALGGSANHHVTVLSGSFGEGYVRKHLPGCAVGTYMSDASYEWTYEDVTYTVNKTQNGQTLWVVTNAPVANS